MNPWIQVTGWTLIHFVWQGALLAVLTAAALGACRRRSSETRYAIACASLVAMLGAVAVTAVSIDVPSLASADDKAVSTTDGIDLPVARASDELLPVANVAVPIIEAEIVLPFVVWAWLVGVTFFVARFSGGCWRIQRLKSAALAEVTSSWQAAGDRLAQRIGVAIAFRVVESTLVEAPTLIGWMRPIILLPAAVLSNLTPGQVEALLAHELAHVRRRDYLVNVLQTLAESRVVLHPRGGWV